MTSLTQAQMRALMAPVSSARVKTRSQSGSKLSYLEAYDVRASLIRVFGFGGFDIRAESVDVMEIERDVKNAQGKTTAFRVSVMAKVTMYIRQLDATYTEFAVSSQGGSTLGDVLDFAAKTAVSDAMKRCAINLGTQFGLSLYNKGATHDIVQVLFDPEQQATLAEIRAEKKPLADPTPADAISDDEETPVEEEASEAEPAPKPRTSRARVSKPTAEPAPDSDRPAVMEDVPKPQETASAIGFPDGTDWIQELSPTVNWDQFTGHAVGVLTLEQYQELWRQAKKHGAPDVILSKLREGGLAERAAEERAKPDELAQGFTS